MSDTPANHMRPTPAKRHFEDRPQIKAPKKPCGRSALTNGKRLLLSNGRSKWARRYGDIVSDLVALLGGPESVTEAQISLARRAAALQCSCEADEAAMAGGEAVNIELYTRAANSLRRILVSLGVQPVEKMNRLHVTVAAHKRMVRIRPIERSDQLHVRQTAVDRLREHGEQLAREQAKQQAEATP